MVIHKLILILIPMRKETGQLLRSQLLQLRQLHHELVVRLICSIAQKVIRMDTVVVEMIVDHRAEEVAYLVIRDQRRIVWDWVIW
jgi:hypothetical protein